MEVKTKKYVRKPIYVDAVKVTAKNFAKVMAWAGGEEKVDEDESTGTTKKYIFLDLEQTKHARQKKAFIGDWVLKTDKGFKIYSNYAFHRSFDNVETEAPKRQVEVDPQQSDVFLKWMDEDFQAYWGTLSDEDKKRLVGVWTNATGMPLAASAATPEDAIVTAPQAIENVDLHSIGPVNGTPGPGTGIGEITEVGPDGLTEADARELHGLPEKPIEEPVPVVRDGNGVGVEDSPTAPPVER